MKSPILKRSIVIAGHKTSVSIEDAFWNGLKDIAPPPEVRRIRAKWAPRRDIFTKPVRGSRREERSAANTAAELGTIRQIGIAQRICLCLCLGRNLKPSFSN